MATVADVIKRALRSIKAIDSAETPSATAYSDAIETLNGMFHLWSAGIEPIYAPTQVTASVASGTGSLTIGSGADVDTTRPKQIYAAYLRDSNGNDYPLEVKSLKEYTDIVLKSVGGTPEYLYVRKGYPNWTVYFDAETDTTYTIYLELLQPLPTFTAETDTFSLPAEYEDAAVYNLAVRLHTEYSTGNLSPIVGALAQGSFKVLKRLNIHPVPEASVDVPGQRRRSNIYEG